MNNDEAFVESRGRLLTRVSARDRRRGFAVVRWSFYMWPPSWCEYVKNVLTYGPVLRLVSVRSLSVIRVFCTHVADQLWRAFAGVQWNHANKVRRYPHPGPFQVTDLPGFLLQDVLGHRVAGGCSRTHLPPCTAQLYRWVLSHVERNRSGYLCLYYVIWNETLSSVPQVPR